MDDRERLFAAARTNKVAALRRLLRTDPDILSSESIVPSNNPLHVAALHGHRNFARAVLQENPKLSLERNAKGYYPIHLASSKGHFKIVDDIIQIYNSASPKEQCFMTDLEGRTPLHLAAIKGHMDTVSLLLTLCAESATKVTLKLETVLHLVVKYNLCEVTEYLIALLENHNILDGIVNCRDVDGNTVLHLAVAGKQVQMLKILSRIASNDTSMVNLAISVMDSSETKTTINSDDQPIEKKPSNKIIKKLLNGIIVLNSLLFTISVNALLTLLGGLAERALPTNSTHVKETLGLQKLAISRRLPPTKPFYSAYKFFSAANDPTLSIRVPGLKGPVKYLTFRSEPYHLISFLQFDTTCFFISLATIILALVLSLGSWEHFFFFVTLMTIVNVVVAGYLYASILAVVTNTPTAFFFVAYAITTLLLLVLFLSGNYFIYLWVTKNKVLNRWFKSQKRTSNRTVDQF